MRLLLLLFVPLFSEPAVYAQNSRGEYPDSLKSLEYLHDGLRKFDLKKYSDAVSDCDKALTEHSRNWKALRLRAMAKKELRKFEESISDFLGALDVNSRDTLSLKGLAIARLLTNDFKNALSDFDRAIQLDSTDGNLYFGRAQCYYSFKDYKKAVLDFNRFIGNNKIDWNYPYLLRGQAYYEDAEYRRAISDFSKYLKMGGDLPAVYFKRGVSYLRLNIADSSINDLEKFKSFYPKTTPTYRFLGMAYTIKMDSILARRCFEEGLKLNPSDLETCYYWAGAEINFENYAKALQLFERVFPHIDKPTAQNFSWLGMAKVGTKDTLGANVAFETALKIDSTYQEVYAARIKMYYSSSKYVSIKLKDFHKLIELTSSSKRLSLLYASRGLMNYRASQIKEAKEDIQKAVELSPQEPICYLVRGILSAGEGNLNEAVANFDIATKQNPKLAEAYLLKACLYTNMGNHKTGCEQLRKATSINTKMALPKDLVQRICSGNSKTTILTSEMERIPFPYIKESIMKWME